MVKALNKLFIETLKLSPDMWLYIALGIIVVAFLVTLIVGLLTGEFKKVKGLMSSAASKPGAVIAVMQKMPIHISKQYKRARVMNMKPSDLVTEQECVALPYKRSLVSKIWLVTFVATVIAAGIAFCAGFIASSTDDAVLVNAPYLLGIIALLVGGLLTLLGGIVGKVVYGGALKTFVKFAQAIDGDGGQAHAQAATQAQAQQQAMQVQQAMQAQQAYAYAPEQVVEESVVEAQTEYAGETQAGYAGDDNDAYVEQPMAAEPVFEPVMQQEQESEEEIRRRAREEAMAQMRAQQQAQAEAHAAAQAAQHQHQEEAMAQMRAQQQAQAHAAAHAQAAPTGSSSADSVIARIEQIDREGAPRETMREVATLLQQERAKPENKTPEQQKRLNEALSKLLKAMSAASKK